MSPDDHTPHLSLEEVLNLLPVQRIEVKVHQLLRHFRLNVAPELHPQLVHGQLFCQAGLQLFSIYFAHMVDTPHTKKQKATTSNKVFSKSTEF